MSVVEQAERDIQRLPEAAVGIVTDLSGVDDDAHPQLASQGRPGQALVVAGQETAERGNDLIQQHRLGCLIDRMDEREDAVATIDEPVAMTRMDSRRAQRLVE
jgi:hypothetical protein